MCGGKKLEQVVASYVTVDKGYLGIISVILDLALTPSGGVGDAPL